MTNEIKIKKCPICDNSAQRFPIIRDNEHYICPECGEYKISGTDLKILENKPLIALERNRVSQAIRNSRSDGLLIPAGFIDDARRES
jgi:predicted RNA-binding Zn-ribbon protein involved in translation (DUF1610 family)